MIKALVQWTTHREYMALVSVMDDTAMSDRGPSRETSNNWNILDHVRTFPAGWKVGKWGVDFWLLEGFFSLFLFFPNSPLLSTICFLRDLLILISCVWVFCPMSMSTTCMPWSQRSEKGSRSLGTGLIDDYERQCRWWGPNLGPPKEQQGLLTTEPSLWVSNML